MSDAQALVPLLVELGRSIRDGVVEACRRESTAQLGSVAADGPGDTIYRIDRLSESVLVARLEEAATALGGIVLVAEGLAGGELVLSRGRAGAPAWRFVVDPIDGTRGIMYQKRSAWVLVAAAPNRGPETRLSDVVVASQTEIPLQKQHLCDELWAVRGRGVSLRRFNRLTRDFESLPVRPSAATGLEHGYAMLSRFFPGARDELAAIDEEIMRDVLGPAPEGKALCFEDQYASTGGQLYELMMGHDRFNADLRPLMRGVLSARGLPAGLCCHPYDVCTALIAEEAGVVLTDPYGGPLDVVLDVASDVAWVGYANAAIRARVEPALQRALRRRGLMPPGAARA